MNRILALPLALLMALCLTACGPDWSVGPDGGSSFSRMFRYYYGEDCRYDSFGAHDCTDLYSLPSVMSIRLQVTYDGYATLCVDGDCSYYDSREYAVDYDHGVRYYDFYGDDTRLLVYADGSESVYIDINEGYICYYYPDYYY